MEEPAVRVRDLTKQYGSGVTAVYALKGVDLDVHRGEVLMLLGPSGSGKTTLLSIIGCILTPTSGSVRIHGLETVGLSSRELPLVRIENIGFIFQGFNLFPSLSARENVEIVLDLKGTHGAKSLHRADELLERVGLGDKLNAWPEELSGGQKQRVAIARALAGNPKIILADEPTAALDSHSGRKVMEMLHDLAHEQGRAVVVVTHDSRVFNFADRIVLIEDGEVREGSEADVLHHAPSPLPSRWL